MQTKQQQRLLQQQRQTSTPLVMRCAPPGTAAAVPVSAPPGLAGLPGAAAAPRDALATTLPHSAALQPRAGARRAARASPATRWRRTPPPSSRASSSRRRPSTTPRTPSRSWRRRRSTCCRCAGRGRDGGPRGSGEAPGAQAQRRDPWQRWQHVPLCSAAAPRPGSDAVGLGGGCRKAHLTGAQHPVHAPSGSRRTRTPLASLHQRRHGGRADPYVPPLPHSAASGAGGHPPAHAPRPPPTPLPPLPRALAPAQTYGRAPVVLSHGQGAKVYDVQGREYVDFAAGIAVNALGHSDPRWLASLTEQAGKLSHTSNLYHTTPQVRSHRMGGPGRPRGRGGRLVTRPSCACGYA